LNICDLDFFNAIQSLQYDKAPRTIDELITAVETSFQEMSKQKLNDNFLTLQKVMETVIMHKGSNHYQLPHMNKEKLRREGKLPDDVKIDEKVYKDGKACIDIPVEEA